MQKEIHLVLSFSHLSPTCIEVLSNNLLYSYYLDSEKEM